MSFLNVDFVLFALFIQINFVRCQPRLLWQSHNHLRQLSSRSRNVTAIIPIFLIFYAFGRLIVVLVGVNHAWLWDCISNVGLIDVEKVLFLGGSRIVVFWGVLRIGGYQLWCFGTSWILLSLLVCLNLNLRSLATIRVPLTIWLNGAHLRDPLHFLTSTQIKFSLFACSASGTATHF